MSARFEPSRWHEAIEGEASAGRHALFRRGLELAARAALAAAAPGDRWLDLGCGTGTLARRLAAAGLRTIGIDHDSAMVGFAAGRSHEVGAWIGADGTALPLTAGSVDGVALVSLLGLVERPAELFAECARVLRPGGRLVVTATNAASWSVWASGFVARLRSSRRPSEGGPARYRLYRPKQIEARLRVVGLRPGAVTFYGHLGPPRHGSAGWSAAALARAEARESRSARFEDRFGARNFLVEARAPR